MTQYVIRWGNVMARYRPILSVALAAILAAATPSAGAEKTSARALREARALFRVVLTSNFATQRCTYSTSWSGHDIPASMARKYLGLKVKGNVPQPNPDVGPTRVLDLGANQEEAFCSVEDYKHHVDQAVQLPDADNGKKVYFQNYYYTFPLFNAGANKAIVIETEILAGFHRTNTGAEADPVGLREDAVVYAKSHGVWREIARETLSIT